MTKRRLNLNIPIQTIPAHEGVRRFGPGEGETLDVAGVHLTWKVKSEDSAYAFSICEHTLASGDGVPVLRRRWG
jgi:hypothetical protein